MPDTLGRVSPLHMAAKKTLTPEEVERAAVRALSRPLAHGGENLTRPAQTGCSRRSPDRSSRPPSRRMTEHVGYPKHAVQGRKGGRVGTLGSMSKHLATFLVAAITGGLNILVAGRT